MRQKLGEFSSALAVFGELELGSEQRGVRIDERGAVAFDELFGRRFAVPFLQRRFVIEQFEVARRAGHEEVNDALGLGGELRLLRREWTRERRGRGPAIFTKERAERDGAEADAALLEEPAARDEFGVKAAVEMGLAIHNFKMTNDE